MRVLQRFRDTYKMMLGNLLNYKQLDIVHLNFLLLLKTAAGLGTDPRAGLHGVTALRSTVWSAQALHEVGT